MAITTDTLGAKDVIPSSFPATKGFAITPHDTNFLSETINSIERQIVTRAIMIGNGTTLKVLFAGQSDGNATSLSGLVPGVVYPFAVKKVYDTDSDATIVFGFR